MREAVAVNNTWQYHAISKEPVVELKEPNPFLEDQD